MLFCAVGSPRIGPETAAQKLAHLAANAVRNWDLARAIELLKQIGATCDGEVPPNDLRMVKGDEGMGRG